MSSGYVPVEKLDVTLEFERLADWIWQEVSKWPKFAQNTVGEQLVRSADSVAANIIEGGNREGDPDSLRFFVFARGSAGEADYWLRRAIRRNLVAEKEANLVLDEWTAARHRLSRLISYRRSTRWKVRELVPEETD